MLLVRLLCGLTIYAVFALLFPILSAAQDSTVSRFEAGGSFTAIRDTSFSGEMGPGVEGGVNFRRYLAFDAAFSWLPATFSHTLSGFYGAKVGTRTERFGFFWQSSARFF